MIRGPIYQGYEFARKPMNVIEDMDAKIARLKERIALAEDWQLAALTAQLKAAEKAREKELRAQRREDEQYARDAAELHDIGNGG